MKTITQNQLTNALMRTLYLTYYKWIEDATPKKRGIVADNWEVVEVNDGIAIRNEEYGDVVKFLEFGTKPHIIKPKDKSVLNFQIGGKEIFAKFVRHPGIQARKFITQVMDNKSNEIKFKNILEKEFERLLEL